MPGETTGMESGDKPERRGDDPGAVPRPPAALTDEQRNGSIAGIALLLGFSLSFTATWTEGDEPWRLRSLITFALAAVGIALQLRSLLVIFSLPNISVESHRRATGLFLRGVVAILVAYLLDLLLDMASDLGFL
jgi:hypothetical protein